MGLISTQQYLLSVFQEGTGHGCTEHRREEQGWICGEWGIGDSPGMGKAGTKCATQSISPETRSFGLRFIVLDAQEGHG